MPHCVLSSQRTAKHRHRGGEQQSAAADDHGARPLQPRERADPLRLRRRCGTRARVAPAHTVRGNGSGAEKSAALGVAGAGAVAGTTALGVAADAAAGASV